MALPSRTIEGGLTAEAQRDAEKGGEKDARRLPAGFTRSGKMRFFGSGLPVETFLEFLVPSRRARARRKQRLRNAWGRNHVGLEQVAEGLARGIG